MRIALTVQDTENDARDFVVDVDPDASVGDVLLRVGADGIAAAHGDRTISVSGRNIDRTASLRAAGVRHGSVLTVHRDRFAEVGEPSGLVDIGVASGAGAGRVVRLSPRRHLIGGSPAAPSHIPILPHR